MYEIAVIFNTNNNLQDICLNKNLPFSDACFTDNRNQIMCLRISALINLETRYI